MAKLTPEEREILINALVETEAIEEDDRSVYEKLRDDKLIAFSEIALNSETDDDDDDDDDADADDEEVVDNSEDESDDDEDSDEDFEDDDEDEEEPATNAHVCNKCAGKMKGKKGKKSDAMEEEDEMTGNAMTAEEWFNSAPPEIAEVVANAMKLANDEKAKLIDQMTSNMSGTAKKQAISIYSNNTLDELKILAPSMVQNSQPKMTVGQVPGMTRRSFAGAATPGGTTNNSKSKPATEPLVMPTINWAEAVKEFSN